MKFNEKLKQLIWDSGITNEEIATKLNVTIDTLNSWETGKTIPDDDKLVELSKLFDTDLSSFTVSNNVVNKEVNNSTHLDSDDLKPRKWLLYVLIIIEIIIVIILADKFINNMNNKKENKNSIFSIFDFGISEQLINNFNSDFEFYDGTQYGSSTSILIDNIVKNNKTNPEHLIIVKYGDLSTNIPNEIKDIKKGLQIWNEYEISMEYDDDGYICEVLIEVLEKENETKKEEDISTFSFNSVLEMYSGTSNGVEVKWLIDKVITSNKKNNKHLITVIYRDINTTDENTIRNLKQQIGDVWTEYEVILDYDEAGYIYKITIQS